MDIHQGHSYSASSPLPVQPTNNKELGQTNNLSTLNFSFMYWFIKLISFQVDIFYNCISALLSPFLPTSSSASESLPQFEEAKENIESDLTHSAKIHSSGSNNNIISLLARKIVLGLLSAAYVCMVLVFVMILAVILGTGLVRMFIEEPVFMREELSFDYSDVHPTALFLPPLGSRGGDKGGFVPVGHAFYVSLVIWMPESEYNRDVGVFQLKAELIGKNGDVTARSSHPCMLRYRSWPIQAFRTFFMGIPLLLGLTTETQKLSVPILQHKESFSRTEAITISMIPRAGTSYLPQIYGAEILVESQLPWKKELLRRWKWTFCVWASFYIYIWFLILLFFFFKPLIFPLLASTSESNGSTGLLLQPNERGSEDREVSETLQRWRQRRNKRKSMLLERSVVDSMDSSGSSITFTKDFPSPCLDEDMDDSESVCFRGR